jgi:hypothetical protein
VLPRNNLALLTSILVRSNQLRYARLDARRRLQKMLAAAAKEKFVRCKFVIWGVNIKQK